MNQLNFLTVFAAASLPMYMNAKPTEFNVSLAETVYCWSDKILHSEDRNCLSPFLSFSLACSHSANTLFALRGRYSLPARLDIARRKTANRRFSRPRQRLTSAPCASFLTPVVIESSRANGFKVLTSSLLLPTIACNSLFTVRVLRVSVLKYRVAI